MDFRLRPAQAQDAAGLAAVHVQSWKETYAGLLPEGFLGRMTNDTMRLRREQLWSNLVLDSSRITYVVSHADTVVGFVNAGAMREHLQASTEQDKPYDAEINAIYLLRSAQGSGLGRALFLAASDKLRARGFKSMALWVLKGNPTCAFYRHMGGEQDGEKRVAIPEGELLELRFGWRDLKFLT
ncbi:GNAT family N-acetyltransferase [Deinococcus hopiensis]|uniref:L-amino acid N-acyltransferase YncA n=1 Tax=Deinococcus hopiensis KR-140 TaxID=695939 RepID=A0A1W1UQ00_9DEIO|nr:GNAT family N-acetyltransferase [Deinococcus hopiensis]SMB82881.1 L-amino acid N-acyltransferase YncA [Deinococcus hopiensis KR-140]